MILKFAYSFFRVRSRRKRDAKRWLRRLAKWNFQSRQHRVTPCERRRVCRFRIPSFFFSRLRRDRKDEAKIALCQRTGRARQLRYARQTDYDNACFSRARTHARHAESRPKKNDEEEVSGEREWPSRRGVEFANASTSKNLHLAPGIPNDFTFAKWICVLRRSYGLVLWIEL